MTKLTSSQIGQIRTRISWIQTEAERALNNSALLGHPDTDDEAILSQLCIVFDNISIAAKRAKQTALGEEE